LSFLTIDKIIIILYNILTENFRIFKIQNENHKAMKTFIKIYRRYRRITIFWENFFQKYSTGTIIISFLLTAIIAAVILWFKPSEITNYEMHSRIFNIVIISLLIGDASAMTVCFLSGFFKKAK